MDNEFEKAYEPKTYEDDIYSAWQESGFFVPENLPGERKEAFSMVLPPPNVTGTLHLGHAMMLAIEDLFARHARLSGKDVLWIPGTDHAAIATQTKVEKLLIEEGIDDPKHTLGREAFLEKVKAFAQDSHDTIVGQAKKMGASLDWTREAYTLDTERSEAVVEAFKQFHEADLLYQGLKVVNWCPRCQSTLSDDELNHKETEAKLYTFRYNKDIPVVISSTRPETKVGDTAIAVSIDDARYTKYLGQEFACEFAGSPLRLKVVADEAVDASFGSGALGVTPAHSKIDEEIAGRHNLPVLSVIGEDGRMLDEAGDLVRGKFVIDARKAVVEWLISEGLMESEETTIQNTPVCYRCDAIVESLPKKQWFINVNKPFAYKKPATHAIEGLEDGQLISLKEMMLYVVKEKQIKIIPSRFEKTYFHWIENLRDWNVSRQIWFGHRIPVWYGEGREVKVSKEAPENTGWTQDEDTLDTWFSSGIWTCSTLGWPKKTNDLATYHPTSVLETGYDILFFWVARMILMTTFLTGQVPFKDVYLHGLVRDEEGRKMSKSLGNVIDPLDMIAKYGADATRLALVIGGSPGNDMKLSEDKIAGFRNFTNKLWNISRFVLTSVEKIERVEKVEPRTLTDKWVLSEFSELVTKTTQHLEKYEMSLAGELLRDFTWNTFADWYLEIAKIQRGDEKDKGTTDQILLYILERLLTLWHPFMPFVTEVLWKHFNADLPLIVGAWPTGVDYLNLEAKERMNALQEVIVAIRGIRATYKVDQSKAVPVFFDGDENNLKLVLEEQEVIKRLARVESVKASSAEDSTIAASSVARGLTIRIPLAGLVDFEKEKARLESSIAQAESEITRLGTQLSNTDFTSRAPEKVVNGMRDKLKEAEETKVSLQKELDTLNESRI